MNLRLPETAVAILSFYGALLEGYYHQDLVRALCFVTLGVLGWIVLAFLNTQVITIREK